MGHRQDDGQSDMAGVWNDLQALVRDVVEQMNHIGEFRQRTGGLDFQRGLYTIVVKKHLVPAVYLTLTRRTDVIDVHYKVLINHSNATEQEMRETLRIEIDNTRRVLFRNNEGECLTTERVVFYILRPFLRPADLIKSP
jgi:hypothetical protein